MSKKLGFLNISVSIIFRLVLLITTLLIKRYLIRFIGNDVNGINSLYTSIITVLSVTELGIGQAIVFSMYAPIARGDNDKISALYFLYRRAYQVIGAIIFVCGIVVMPLLPALATNDTSGINLYGTFFLVLISTCISYLFSAKTSLINAYANNYITTTISSGVRLVQEIVQIAVIILTRSYFLFLVVHVLAALLSWVITNIVTERKYPDIISNKQSLDAEDRHQVMRNVKALFMHRIGGILVNSADSIIISYFIGVGVLGSYSNYVSLMTATIGTIMLLFTPLTNLIGNLYARKSKQESLRYFNFFFTANYMVSCIFFLGYYAIVDNLIIICFSRSLMLHRGVAFTITVNYFIQYMRNTTSIFRSASGTFYYDRWRPFLEGISNVILSVGFVLLLQDRFGDEIAVVGVIVATIITNLTICDIVEPYVVFKYAFDTKASRFYRINYSFIALFIAMLIVLNFCMVDIASPWHQLFANGFIAVGIGLIPCGVAFFVMKDFRFFAKVLITDAIKRLRKLWSGC